MFDSRTYEVREKSLSDGDQHKIYEDGELQLYSRIEKQDLREDVTFKDRDGKEVMKVTNDPKLDVPVSYSILDDSGTPIGGLRREWGSIQHTWKLIGGDNQVIATIKEDFLPLSVVRRFVTTLLPFKYDVVSTSGEKIADIDGKLQFRDLYRINICGDVDPRLMIAAAIVIDAIEKK